MKTLNTYWSTRADWFSSDGREQSIRDYIFLANQLMWKRQASFLTATMLAAFYFDPISILACYGVVVLTELLDVLLERQSKSWDGQDPVVGRQILKHIARNTAVSGMAIGVFSINIAVQQTSAGHFTPLFFLFSASVFAAMYNSQMIGILLLRLSTYGFAFLYIAFLDVFRYLPPLSSHTWLEFFTTIFVLYFIGDTSAKFYLGYQQGQEQMKIIKQEHEQTKTALEVKAQFLATVSHELRTPLTHK
jgi:signal transduction histidine kinase